MSFVPHQSLPSSNNFTFGQVPSIQIERSSFDRSHTLKTTFDSGYLLPIFCDEVYPGDTFQLSAQFFARLATPLTPFMDNLHFETFFFFVPNRLVWDNWQKQQGERVDPDDSIDYLTPQVVSPAVTGWDVGSVYDHFGLPVQTPGISANVLPLRGMNLCWNDWFRDQNLQDSLVVNRGDGPDDSDDYVLLKRNKRHDYFTSCLPWAQKGDPVDIPLLGSAPIVRDASAAAWKVFTAGGDVPAVDTAIWSQHTGTLNSSSSPGVGLSLDPNGGLSADLTDVSALTINSLREAFMQQTVLERDARGGTRYTEILRSHFGVVSPDARLQRPEFLGGGRTPVMVNPIAQTSATTDTTTPLANLAAVGTIRAQGHSFGKSFVEHGFILGFACVFADLTYQQGLNRMWSRRTRYDYYLPAFAHLGEQAVLNKEIYAQGTPADDEVFGYNEHWAELRYKPSMITGQFRSQYAQSLDVWHLAQDFTTLPVLGSDFITENPPVNRVVAVESPYPQFLLDGYFHLKCTRPIPLFSVPGWINRF